MDFIKNSRLILALVLVLAFGFLGTTAYADSEEANAGKGTDWKFHTIVDVEFVKQYAKVPQPEGVMIIDSRPYKPKYIKGHIPMAKSIPHSQFDKKKDMLPKDKNAILIFYCGGPT